MLLVSVVKYQCSADVCSEAIGAILIVLEGSEVLM